MHRTHRNSRRSVVLLGLISALYGLAACSAPNAFGPGASRTTSMTSQRPADVAAQITSPLGVQRTFLWSDEFVPVIDSDGRAYIDRNKWNTTYNTGWGPFLRAYGDTGGFHRWVDKDYKPAGISDAQVLNPFSFPEPGVLRISSWPVPPGPVLNAYSGDSVPPENRMSDRARFATGLLASDSKFHYRFGYIEARIRVPGKRGTWPAFWMMSIDPSIPIPPKWGTTEREHEMAKQMASKARPQMPEFDIMEYLGHVPARFTTAIHSVEYDHLDYHTPGPNLDGAWHTYGFDWSPTDWAFTFDGKIVQQGKAFPSFAIDHYPILCMQIGGDWYKNEMLSMFGKAVNGWEVDDASMPWQMDVDYVRVWQ
ncbi:MAG: glycoside hydrolase family 16 protein [Methylotetracoccus sp.]